MKTTLTSAERAALIAVRDGKVERVYKHNGNVVVPPRSVSARTVWTLIAMGLVCDAKHDHRATIIRCKMELTPKGTEALA